MTGRLHTLLGAALLAATLVNTAVAQHSPVAAAPGGPTGARSRGLVRDSANVIRDPHHTLDTLFNRLATLRESDPGTVSILHLGDSHIQGGYLTGRTRAELQRVFGNAGRGLIVPLRLCRTNEPTGYGIASPNVWSGSRLTQASPAWTPGIGGIALAGERCPVSFLITTPADDPFCCVTVFHHPEAPMLLPPAGLDPGTYCPDGNTATRTVIPLAHSTDSLLLGSCADTAFNTPVFYGFSLENGRPGLLYHSSGINGASFGHFLSNPELVRQTAELAPGLIVVSLGTNDALGSRFSAEQLYAQIDMLAGSLQAANPGVPILLTTPMEIGQRRRVRGRTTWSVCPGIGKVRDVILRVARDRRLAVWDLYATTGGSGANARWREAGLVRADRVHLTVEGYELQGTLLSEAILRAYDKYLKRRNPNG